MSMDIKDNDEQSLRASISAYKRKNHFELARELLNTTLQNQPAAPQSEWLIQQLVICTYQDQQLLPDTRFSTALSLLADIGLRDPANTNADTLALGGSVYKKRFEYSGQLDDLFQALHFYRAAWQRNPQQDNGYGGINAAFVLDLLATQLDSIDEVDDGNAARYNVQAKTLRTTLTTTLEKQLTDNAQLGQSFCFIATLAEAHFGLGHFDRAIHYFDTARKLKPDECELQATTQQLVKLARLHGYSLPKHTQPQHHWAPPWQALTHLLGKNAEETFGCFRNKVGLALSGGGFRASFFHIGVMARLAEMDMLRGVEVLSTVSGGSILGAHYYLLLRNLLQTKQDHEITAQDYVDLVDTTRREFFAGVARNIRMRTFANLFANLRMLFSWPMGKHRTQRLGKLYEKLLYGRVADQHPDGAPRLMRKLLIAPRTRNGNDRSFIPTFSNWRRRSKVPTLVINATSLNTGHAWHFNAKGMGEPPALVGEEIDMKPRYRRPYYSDLSSVLHDYRLGHAVAASSCVPGLFAPLEIKQLYNDRVVHLVDGGVHDNQGLQALLAEGCNFVLCSDASGQICEQTNPRIRELSVLNRVNDILGSRMREIEFQHFKGLDQSRALGGFLFVHLKKGLDSSAIDWLGCNRPTAPIKKNDSTDYGVATDLQTKLAAIRTDLDSFTETEANALMLSGYLMTEHELKTNLRDIATHNGFEVDAPRGAWPFLELEPAMSATNPAAYTVLAQQLDISAVRFFKAWRLSPVLRGLGKALLLTILIGLIWGFFSQIWGTHIVFPTITVGWQLIWKLLAGLLVIGLALVGLFTLLVNLHLLLIDPIYRRCGDLNQFLTRISR